MEWIFDSLRIVHIAAGFAALVVAPIAMVTAKGGAAHRRAGKLYYRAMAVIAITAVVLGLARGNMFLTMIAVFSFYGAFSGYRVLARKRPDQRPDAIAWAMALLTLGVSVGLVLLGLLPPTPRWQSLAVVSLMLGAIGIVLSGRDVLAFVRPPAERMAWWYSHMSGMLSSYIAVVTAFSVVNFTFLPLTARWLWPGWIGGPLIALWIGYHRRRFRDGARNDRPLDACAPTGTAATR
jgi:hypothetical protein